MNPLELESENTLVLPSLEEELPEMQQIPISGIEVEVESFSPLVEEPIESPLAASAYMVPTRSAADGDYHTDDNTDILTGLPLEEESSPVEPRRKKKKDPGNNVKKALNLGKVGDDPINYSDNIGIKSGKSRDKNDYYKFTLQGKENEVSVVVDGLKGNANLQLLNKNGKTVLFKSAKKGKQAEIIDAELDRGTYYLRVYPQGKAKTKYGLSISAEEILKDPDSKPNGATDLGPLVKKKKVFNDEIGFKENGSRDNSDFYKFTLAEDFNNLNIVLDGLRADANIELLDRDGETIIDQSRNKRKGKEIIDGVLDGGSYYLKVEPKGSARTKYRLSFDSDKISDPDGSLKRADNLGVLGKKPKKNRDEIGFEVAGKRDQKDYYEFSLKKGSEINLTLDGLNQNADLKLLDKRGGLLYSSTNGGKEIEQISTILDRGKYYALVQPVGGDRSEYLLTLDGDNKINDADAQLPGKKLGKIKAKPISKTDDIGFKKRGFVDTSDFWQFELTKETDLTITLDRLRQNADLELYDKDGTTLIYSSKKDGKRNENISTILDKGVYYVRVKSVSGSSTKYKLSVSGNTKIAEKDDELPGTDLGELGVEKIGAEDNIGFESSENTRDLADFYNFSLAEKTDVNVTLDGLAGGAKLSLLAASGGQIEVSNNKGKRNENIDAILEPGNYYVGVEPDGGKAKTKYDLGLSGSPVNDDFGGLDDAKQLGSLNLQDEVIENNRIGFKQGSVRDSQDYFGFNLTETSDVSLFLDGLSRDANLFLLDAKGNEVTNSSAKGSEPEVIKQKLERGSYYGLVIPVGGAKTDYEFSLDAVEKTVDLSGLKFEVLGVEDGVKPGEKVEVSYQIENGGSAKANAFEVGFYLSPDEGIDGGDRLLETGKVKSLAGGKKTKKLTQELILPGEGDRFWEGAGDYYLGMVVDNQEVVTEVNELNNTDSAKVTVSLGSGEEPPEEEPPKEEPPEEETPSVNDFILNFGEVEPGSIKKAGKEVSYTFNAQPNDKVSIVMTRTSGEINPIVSLYAPDGSLVVASSTSYRDDHATGFLDATSLNQTGTYTILATDQDGNETGNFNIGLQRTNNPGNSKAIKFGDTIASTLNVGTNLKSYSFSAEPNDKVSILMTRTSGEINPIIRLYNPDGSLAVASSTSYRDDHATGFLDAVSLNQTGTYTILTTDQGGNETGNFNLSLQRTSSPANSKNINFGDTVASTLDVGTDLKSYSFSAEPNDKVSIQMTRTSGEINPIIRLYAPDGSLAVASSTSYRDDHATGFLDAVSLNQTGKYTILTTDQGGNETGNFNLSLQRTSSPANSKNINFGDTVASTLDVGTDLKSYSFSAEPNDKVSIQMTRTSGEINPIIRLYAPDGSLAVASSTSYRDDHATGFLDAVSLNQTGTYTILTTDQGGNETGNFNLSLQRTSNPANSTEINFGEVVAGTLDVGTDFNSYSFSAQASDKVSIIMGRTDGEINPIIRLYNPDGSLVVASDGSYRDDHATGLLDAVSLNQTGTYTILATDQGASETGNFNLNLQRTNNPGNSKAIKFGKTVAGVLDVGIDLKPYTFSAQANDTVSIQMTRTSGEVNPIIRLYAPDGSLVQASGGSYRDDHSEGFLEAVSLSQTGKYTILATDQGSNETGKFNLKLQRG